MHRPAPPDDMKLLLALLTSTVLTTQGVLGKDVAPLALTPTSNTARDEVVRAANSFALRLYQEVSSTPGNLVLSPISASVLLALLRHGAAGTTAEQLTSALHLPSDLQATAAGCKAMIQSLQSTGNASLHTANKMYVQRNFRLNKSFRQTAINSFRVSIAMVNFVNNVEGARRVINSWVEDNTNGKIQNLFERGILTPLTRLVLVNAIYFKAAWLNYFEKDKTSVEAFHVTPTRIVNVSTMHRVLPLEYGRIPELNASAVKLPYDTKENDMSMIILLPDALDGLEQLEAGLGQLDLNNLMRDAQLSDVNLSLPKFRIVSKHNLKQNLQELGITEVFNPIADLSNIGDGNLYVTDAVQKAFVGVDEEGTEGAVATGVSIGDRFGSTIADFTVDRPFLFVVKKGTTVLFLGRVTDPKN